MPILSKIVRALENGANLNESELLALAAGPREDLFDTAEAVTRKMAPRAYNLCGIINVKSGECSENCRWCAQSKHWEVPGVKIYPILPEDKVEAGARRAAETGIVRYSLVASGRKPSRREIREYCERIREVKRNHPELEVCVSLGLLSEEDLSALKDAGVVRIHCNLETSPEFFREVCAPGPWGSTSARAASSAWAKRSSTAFVSRASAGSSKCPRFRSICFTACRAPLSQTWRRSLRKNSSLLQRSSGSPTRRPT